MGAKIENRPAFEGARFDKQGYCLTHPRCQLCNPVKKDGKLMYEELHRSCPSCVSEKNKMKRSTSLGGGKVRETRAHGAKPPLSKKGSSRSKSSQRPRRQYDTPFDDKGRCHYHVNVQLAAKKLGGGWKVLHSACPKCMEEDDGDDRSIRSGSSKKSTSSKRNENAKGQYDSNGCCVLHTHVQVAKKKMLGGWKVVRNCPACSGEDVALDDCLSVCSKGSRKSTRSSGSRSVKSSRSTKSTGKPGTAAKSSRYGTLPFDGDGYCCKHPSMLLAQKKMMGGWKIIHNVCPECADEMGLKGSKKAPRRKSSSGRYTDTASESSFKSGSVGSGSAKKKHIRVKNLKTQDEDGKFGKYSGDVNDDYRPHGQGTMKYDDGTIYEGIWSEGTQVHGKMRRQK